MTHYIFAYDLEHADLCLKAAPVLVRWHERYEVPATFFLLGRVLEQRGKELRAILGDSPLFDLQSHTYSHRMLRDNRMHGPGVPLEEVRREVALGKQWVEETFQRPCIGTRPGCGFFRGMQGEPERLAIFVECGMKYISADLRGPADSIPSGLQQAYWYDEEGFPQLLELPGHGWHDNVLKAPQEFHLRLSWPLAMAWGIPNRPVRTPEEEFTVQRVWIARAATLGLDFVSLVYHPWSIYRLSEDCRIVELLMRYVKELGLPTTTYTALYQRYAAQPQSVPGRNSWDWGSQTPQGPLRVGLAD